MTSKKQITGNKCEDNGFEHAWEDVGNDFNVTVYPPEPVDKQETCKNCGLGRAHRSKTKEWIEYSDGVDRDGVVGGDFTKTTTDVPSSGTGGGGITTLKEIKSYCS